MCCGLVLTKRALPCSEAGQNHSSCDLHISGAGTLRPQSDGMAVIHSLLNQAFPIQTPIIPNAGSKWAGRMAILAIIHPAVI
jgi:hypothetical protein